MLDLTIISHILSTHFFEFHSHTVCSPFFLTRDILCIPTSKKTKGKTFVKNDPSAALELGQARAAAIISLGERNLSVAEYSPNYIKKVVSGRGHATKEDIQRMISIQFPRVQLHRSDESDAIAIALCHLHSSKLKETLNKAIEKAI